MPPRDSATQPLSNPAQPADPNAKAGVRRSSRKKVQKINYASALAGSYPDAAPANEFELTVSVLNGQTFEPELFCMVDDLVTYALFATKRRPHSYRALNPARSSADPLELTPQLGQDIKALCDARINALDPTEQECRGVARELVLAYPGLLPRRATEALTHTLLRHQLIYSRHSRVGIQKTSYGDGVCIGVKATQAISAGTAILTLCGSLASECEQSGGLSVIQSSPTQLGPVGLRVILGPFRFVNHDCRPNCQIAPVRGSHSCTIFAIQGILPGQTITVSYTARGYFDGPACRCASCIPKDPPAAPRRVIEAASPKKKKIRRGKRRGKAGKKDPELVPPMGGLSDAEDDHVEEPALSKEGGA